MSARFFRGIALFALGCLGAPAVAHANGRYDNAPHPYSVMHITRHIMRDGSTAQHVRVIRLTPEAARRLAPARAPSVRRTANGYTVSHNTSGSIVPFRLPDQIRVGSDVLVGRRDTSSRDGSRLTHTESTRTPAFPGGPIDAALVTRRNRPVRTEIIHTDPVREINDRGGISFEESPVHITVIERPNPGQRRGSDHVLPTLSDVSTTPRGNLMDRLDRLQRATPYGRTFEQ